MDPKMAPRNLKMVWVSHPYWYRYLISVGISAVWVCHRYRYLISIGTSLVSFFLNIRVGICIDISLILVSHRRRYVICTDIGIDISFVSVSYRYLYVICIDLGIGKLIGMRIGIGISSVWVYYRLSVSHRYRNRCWR